MYLPNSQKAFQLGTTASDIAIGSARVTFKKILYNQYHPISKC